MNNNNNNNNNSKIQLEVLGLSYNQNMGNSYTLILQESKGNRKIPIVIGEPETQSIVMVLEGIMTQRPMTHDLFIKLCLEHNIEMDEILIYKLEEGVFYSKLICKDIMNNVKEIDSRTSDAIALALRFECPIYINEDIMDISSIDIGDDNKKIEISDLPEYNKKELEKKLEEAIRIEDYESASTIRDIINKKRKN